LEELVEIYFACFLNHPTIEVVAINDIADNKTMAHLLKYDSIHGVLPFKVVPDDTGVEENIFSFHQKNIANLDWKSLDIDYVIEATGKYKTLRR
jgi:glyceraldehyde 3-phosphate dehydrogenase